MRRLISANASEILNASTAELIEAIRASEGRVILSENVAPRQAFIEDITNAEIARAFGANLILLNLVDVFNPVVSGLDCEPEKLVERLHELTGLPIGVNLEPVDPDVDMMDERLDVARGRTVNAESVAALSSLGFDFVCLTGNPGTGVTNAHIAAAISTVKAGFDGFIIAGKMHAAGVNEPIIDKDSVRQFIDAGADIILAPAVGTVPGFTAEELTSIVDVAHGAGALVMTAIGTSQEGSDPQVIRALP
ncbi:haloacid dehalogenase-like hydrolase [Corynebacterium yudongzhengii]|uniref:DUF7916 family protein n=1 Tax=Corynebacterium yudongzhengii TaxID=2080740 RepID=UPI0018EE4CEC|nr:haloacid dehalogenase-like hydrolase [Corynebacterium yudongzhengii]